MIPTGINDEERNVYLIASLLIVTAAPVLPEGFMLVAHRGVVTEELTENSLASLEETIRRGYTHIEVDIQCTKDGHPVCLHDGNIRRTTGINKKVGDVTLEELRSLVDVGTVPDFEAFCQKCEGRIGLMPDVKACPSALKDILVERLGASLERHGLMKSALFIGRPDMALPFLGKARLSWRVPLETAKASERAKENPGARFFIFDHAADFTEADVKGFEEMGVQVIVSINTHHYLRSGGDPVALGLRDVKQMLAWGVDGLQIDSVYEPALPAAGGEPAAENETR